MTCQKAQPGPTMAQASVVSPYASPQKSEELAGRARTVRDPARPDAGEMLMPCRMAKRRPACDRSKPIDETP